MFFRFIKKYSFSFALLLGFFSPNTTLFYAVLGVIPFLLFILYYKEINSLHGLKVKYLFLLVAIFSFIINVFIGEPILNKDLFRFISIILMFFLFPFVSNVKTSNVVFYFALIYICVSQVAYMLNLSILVTFYDKIYPYTGETIGFTTDYLLRSAGDLDSVVARRYGGLYHNPNQAIRFVTTLLVAFYIENRNTKLIHLIPFIVIVALSILFSGSRTGLVVGIVLTLYYFLFYRSKKLKSSFSLLIVFFMLIYFYILIFGDRELRVFEVSSGIEGSIGTKFSWFMDFFVQLNSPLRLLFGHFTSNNLTNLYGVPMLDSEWGELIYCFGILGFIALTIFYLYLFRLKSDKINFFLIILLWCITSTIIFNYRMSFLFMLLLSKYYSEYLLTNKNKL